MVKFDKENIQKTIETSADSVVAIASAAKNLVGNVVSLPAKLIDNVSSNDDTDGVKTKHLTLPIEGTPNNGSLETDDFVQHLVEFATEQTESDGSALFIETRVSIPDDKDGQSGIIDLASRISDFTDETEGAPRFNGIEINAIQGTERDNRGNAVAMFSTDTPAEEHQRILRERNDQLPNTPQPEV